VTRHRVLRLLVILSILLVVTLLWITSSLRLWPAATSPVVATAVPQIITVAAGRSELAPVVLDVPNEFSFAICGDSRDGDAVYRQILAQVMEDGNRFLVHLGDIVPHGRANEWEAWRVLMTTSGFSLPFFPVPGNHDTSNGLLEMYVRYTGAPGVRYSIEAGPVHLAVLDSQTGALFDSTLDWLEKDLAATRKSVRMIGLHYPPFDPDGTDHILHMGNERLMDIARRFQVNYVWAAHIHAFEHARRDGTEYIITGGCGAPLYAGAHPQGAYHHYIRVSVHGEHVDWQVVRLKEPLSS